MILCKTFIIIIISSICVVNSTNILYKIVKGNLSHTWTFNITIFARDLRGTVFYSVDSEQNKLSIRISVGLLKKFLQLSFNNAFTRTSLSQTCGCDPCDNKIMNFYIESTSAMISVSCNKFGKDSLTKSIIKDNIPPFVSTALNNYTNALFLGIGNIGDSETLIGCLQSFSFNKLKRKFKESGSEFLPTCQLKCTDLTCNKGKCGSTFPIGPLCDCYNSPFNGRYCNRTLKDYNETDRLSLRRRTILNLVQLKVSWKPLSNKTLCLMELIYGTDRLTISINEDHVFKDIPMQELEILSRISSEEINFINVNITDVNMIVRILAKEIIIPLPLVEKFKVNLGYSEKNARCEPFVGKFDVYYNTSQLVRVPVNAAEGRKVPVLWIIVLLVCLVIIASGIAYTVFFIYKRKKEDVSKDTDNANVKLNVNEEPSEQPEESANIHV